MIVYEGAHIVVVMALVVETALGSEETAGIVSQIEELGFRIPGSRRDTASQSGQKLMRRDILSFQLIYPRSHL